MALTIEQAVQREAELRTQLTNLHAEREKLLLAEKPNDNALSALHKKIRDTRDAIEDIAVLRRDAERREAAKRRELNAAEKHQRIEAAREATDAEQKAAVALQGAVQAFAKCYADMLAATGARQAAFRAAGVKYVPAGSLDIMVSREFARAGLQHLSHLNLTGITREPNIPESFTRHHEKARAALDAAAVPKTEAAA